MSVVDVALVPVPRDRREAYLAFAARMAEVYRDHGATRIDHYWQDDQGAAPEAFHAEGAGYEDGELRTLAAAVGAEADEAIAVTITHWPSAQAREQGNASATRDPRVLATLDEEPVFEGSRLLAGDFAVVRVDTSSS